jgi:hypothetical protein
MTYIVQDADFQRHFAKFFLFGVESDDGVAEKVNVLENSSRELSGW